MTAMSESSFRTLLLAGTVMVLGASLPLAAQGLTDLGDPTEHVVILRPGPGAAAQADQLGRLHGAHHVYHAVFQGFSASLAPAALAALRSNPNVELIEACSTVTLSAEVLPSGVDRVDAELVHVSGILGVGARVAIVDTGIDLDHPDLAANVDFGLSETFVSRGRTTISGEDDNGHGTHVAGTVAALLGNGQGVVGMAPGAWLISLKVLNQRGSGTTGDIIAALDAITAHNLAASSYADMIHVANLSLGGGGSDTDSAFRRAFDACVASGCFVVVAAGNESDDSANHVPAAYDSVFTVSAFDPLQDTFASFSNYGPDVDMAAPGVSILSTTLGGGTGTKSGTSMATPHVAGAAALYVAVNLGSLTGPSAPASIRAALLDGGEARSLPGDPDGIQEPLLDAEGIFFTPAPPPPAVTVSLTGDRGTYTETDAVALLTCQPRDETGAAISGLATTAFATEIDSVPAALSFLESGAGVYQATLDISGFGIDLDHLVRVTVTDSRGVSGSGSITIRRTSAPIVHVSSISYRDNARNLFIDVEVSDATGTPVAGATVSITLELDGQPLASGAGGTDSLGIATFHLRHAPSGVYTTIIDDVAVDGGSYDPSLDAPDPGFTR
jgi:subtilisin family serine protease